MAEYALELAGVSAGYGETVVLENIRFAVAPGETVSIIGRNGVGKSTLLATMMGHTTLHAGEMRLGQAQPAARDSGRVPAPIHRALEGKGTVIE